jgi:hypothetical protein
MIEFPERRPAMAESKTAKRGQQPVHRPEHKIGPFHNGLGIAIWCNEVKTADGPRFFRSVTIAPRRYRDPKTGKWKDAVSYRPVDLTTLSLALDNAWSQYLC